MTGPNLPGAPAHLLGPPYDRLTAIDLANPDQPDERGQVLVWNLASESWNEARQLVAERAAGLPLAVILPDRNDHLTG